MGWETIRVQGSKVILTHSWKTQSSTGEHPHRAASLQQWEAEGNSPQDAVNRGWDKTWKGE